jgi:hypothetical protein
MFLFFCLHLIDTGTEIEFDIMCAFTEQTFIEGGIDVEAIILKTLSLGFIIKCFLFSIIHLHGEGSDMSQELFSVHLLRGRGRRSPCGGIGWWFACRWLFVWAVYSQMTRFSTSKAEPFLQALSSSFSGDGIIIQKRC